MATKKRRTSSDSFSTRSAPCLEHTKTPPPPKKVMFSTDPPSVFYSAPITPEDGNSETGSDSGDSADDMVVDHVGLIRSSGLSSDSSESDEPTPPPSPPQVTHKVPSVDSCDSLSTT